MRNAASASSHKNDFIGNEAQTTAATAAIIRIVNNICSRGSKINYAGRSLLRLLLLLPALYVSCGSVFQGPVVGSITLENPSDAGDAVVFLRCRGPGLHGDITTDAEDTRVGADGRFSFIGSLTFPTTEHCYIYVRHPRYQTVRVELADELVQKLEPITLTSWDTIFKAGPDAELERNSRYPWPQSEVYRQLSDTLLWLRTFPAKEQKKMARYVPAIHDIYRQAYRILSPRNTGLRDMLRMIGMIEEQTAYPYPFSEYLEAVKAGNAAKVQAFIEGGVLRETRYRGQSSTLSVAAAQGHLDVIDVLLAHDEPLQIPGCGAPLIAAVGASQWPASLKLIEAGADVEVSCQNRRPLGDALTGFAQSTRLDLLAGFLDAGVPVDLLNSRNTTALAETVAGGNIRSVKALLAAGANPDVRTREGVRLVDDASAKGFLDIERELSQAMTRPQGTQLQAQDTGETISLPWRRGEPASYRVYSNYGHINDIAADPATPGILWLATAGGLLRVHPESGEQRVWARVNGLPASAVQDIWFDTAAGYLWLATPAGLARLPLDELERVETVGSGEPHSSYASGFLPGQPRGVVWYWGGGALYRLQAENSEARRYAFELDLFSAVVIPGSSDFYLGDNSSVWRFESLSGRRELLVDSETLATHAATGPPGLPQPRSLAVDTDAGALWIGSYAHGVFRMDMETGGITRPSLSTEQVAQCARSTAVRHMWGEVTLVGGRTYVQLGRCFGRIDDSNQFVVIREQVDAGPVTDARGDVWFLADNRFHRIDSSGDSETFVRRPDPLGNARVNAIYRIGKRLFVGVEDAPLAVLDLERQSWSTIPGASNVQRLRSVAGRQDVLALGQAHYYWVDPTALTSREMILGPGSTEHNTALHWRDLRDLEFDGEIMWVLRDNRQRAAGKSRRGLYRVARDGYKRYDGVSGYSLGELSRVVQDPSDPERLWLLRNRDHGLVDFNKTTGESVLIGANNSTRRESDLLLTAMSDPRLKTLTTRRHETLDPDAPDLVWGVQGSGLYLQHGARVIHRWPAKLPVGSIEVVRDEDTTVWIASSEGLIAFPIQETLAELTPQTDHSDTNRRPR